LANFVSSSLGNFKNFSYFLKVSIFNFKISFSIQFVRNAGLSKSAAKWELEVKLPKIKELKKQGNRSGGNQENELHGIGWNHYEQAVVIDFIANNSE
jgi:hypothetical protein